MTSTRDIFWLAGLLEGEGYFGAYDCGGTGDLVPRVGLQMSDRDVVERAAEIMRGRRGHITVSGPRKQPHPLNCTRPMYRTSVDGAFAAGWMMTLYPHLGERRRTKIRQCLAAYSAYPAQRVQWVWGRSERIKRGSCHYSGGERDR